MKAIATTVLQFLPVVIFWVVQHYAGLKPAIAVTILLVVGETTWRLLFRLPLSRLYLFTSFMVITFGGIDLYARSPFMLKYEAVITNIVTGMIFLVTSFGSKSLIQQMVEQQSGKKLPDRRDIRVFLRIFTRMWAGYFFLKALAYFYIGQIMPMDRALIYRSAIGAGSLVGMVGISAVGTRLYWLFRRWKLLPEEVQSAPDLRRS